MKNQLVLFRTNDEYCEAQKTLKEARKAKNYLKACAVTAILLGISLVGVLITAFMDVREIGLVIILFPIFLLAILVVFFTKALSFKYSIEYNIERCMRLIKEYESNPV